MQLSLLPTQLFVYLTCNASFASSFVIQNRHHPSLIHSTNLPSSSSSSSSSALSLTPSEAISTIHESQANVILPQIASTIPDLAIKPDFTWTPQSSVTISPQNNVATLDARDAAGPSNIAWLASLNVDSKLSSLTIFNGPLNDVPHLISKVRIVNENTMEVVVDVRPRAYGAWEMQRPDGSFPGPDELGRKSFEYSGARKDYQNKFATAEFQSFLTSTIQSFESASVVPEQSPQELDQLIRGPNYTKLQMPLTPSNVQTFVNFRQEFVLKYWLSWTTDSSNNHRPGAPINSQYVYDTKYKQNAFGSLLMEYSVAFGEADGKVLAVGESGPLDEAYVGGAS